MSRIALVWPHSALPIEECQPLVTPVSLADPSVLYGKINVIAGYTDHQVFNEILKVTDSSWLKISESPVDPKKLVMTEENKLNGKCFSSSVNFTIEGNTAVTEANITSNFKVLPSCEGCLVLSVNVTAGDISKLLGLMNITTPITDDELHVQAVYLMAKESTLKDSDLEHFKKQASCLGFDREPDYVHDTKNGGWSSELPLKYSYQDSAGFYLRLSLHRVLS
uniref:Uncharacterized LOC115051367 n=1 Tax=Echeneis naucrates TaxID=173247 RepID=A0A665U2P1_ECHNA